MRRGLMLAVFVAALLGGAGRVAAQEVQVPLDEAGRLQVVDARLAARMGLFAERYPGFREARLFQAADGGFVLEITTDVRGQTARQRVALSPEEVAALRHDVSQRLAERAPDATLDQEGRYLLLGQTTLLGLGFYGWALPYTLNASNTGAAGLYLLTAGASFFVPYALTQGKSVSFATANLSRYGASRGIAHGLLLERLVTGGPDRHETCLDGYCYSYTDDNDRTAAGFALLTSVAEGVGGYYWARGEQMTAGTANTIAGGGDLGLAWGLGAAYLAGSDGLDERATAAVALPAAAAGVAAGHWLAARRDYTWGDAEVMYTAGSLGALSGAALVAAADGDEKVAVATAIAGSALGVYLADRLVRDTDFTVGHAALNRLGTMAGALVGASVGVLTDEWRVAAAGAAAGGIAGFAATYYTLAPTAREQRGEGRSSWDVQLSPQGLAALGLAGEGRAAPPQPLLTLRYRF